MDDNLLFRFLTKQTTPEENRIIDEWTSLAPENAQWLFQMEKTWVMKYKLKYAEKHRIEEAYQEFLTCMEKKRKKPADKNRWLMVIQYSAVAAIAALLVLNLFQYFSDKKTGFNELYVPTGEMARLVLEDGTSIWLNSESKLTYPTAFIGKERKVSLEGEAYFEVTPNEHSPFKIATKGLETIVLGTSFNVKAYEGEEISVTLLEGSVKVNTSHQNGMILKPNQRAVLSEQGELLLQQATNYAELPQWTSGELIFINESLKNIASALSRKYGVQVQISTQHLEQVVLSSRIQKNATLVEVLEILKETRNLSYKMEGNKIILFN